MKIKERMIRFTQFLKKGIWGKDFAKLSWWERAYFNSMQIFLLSIREFVRTHAPLHAASLTYFSMMSLVPILALALAMARAFGGGDLAKRQINEKLDSWIVQIEQVADARPATTNTVAAPLPATAEKKDRRTVSADIPAITPQVTSQATRAFASQIRTIVNDLLDQLDNISFGKLGGIGAIMLIWTVISVLGKVEESFNEVWSLKKARPLRRKIPDYLFSIIILPFLMIASSTIPVAAKISRLMDKTLSGKAAAAAHGLLASGFFKTGVTLILSAFMFSFLLQFMPNTRVKWIPAVIGGFITAILFNLWFKLCAMLQIGIANYSTLYGGFAVLPILLMWVYISWQIILLGAIIAHAIQNRETFIAETRSSDLSPRTRFLLALTFCTEAAQNAEGKDGGPLSIQAFSKKHGISPSSVLGIVQRLEDDKILAKITGLKDSYLLFRCGKSITVADLLLAAFDEGSSSDALGALHLTAPILGINDQINRHLKACYPQSIFSLDAKKD